MKPQEYIDRRLKAPKSFFEWCYSQIPMIYWENKNQKITTNRKNCSQIKRQLRKNVRLTFFDDYYLFVIILVTKKRIEIQSYSIWSKYIDGIQYFDTELSNFELFEGGKYIQVTYNCYSKGYQFGLTKIYGYMSGYYTGAQVFPNESRKKIETISELKYLDLFQLSVSGILKNLIYEIPILYKYKDEIEFAQKINAPQLALDITRGCGDMRIINKNWLRKNKRFFKNSDRDFISFEFERRIKARNGTVVPGIKKYLTYVDINRIPKGIGIIKFQNWVIKNKVNFKYYLDYLGVLKDLKVELNENLICPKNLTKAHDEAVKLLNQLKREAEEKEYDMRLKKIMKLEKEIKGYVFLVPHKMNELIVEGKALHHCVGSSMYLEKHRKGQTTIIFVREKEHIDKPLYTLEFKNNKIEQIRGKHNQLPPTEVKEIADFWLNSVTKKMKGNTTAYGT